MKLACSLAASAISFRFYRVLPRRRTPTPTPPRAGRRASRHRHGAPAVGGHARLTRGSPREAVCLGMLLSTSSSPCAPSPLVRAWRWWLHSTWCGANSHAERSIRRVLVYGIGDKSASVISRLRNSTHYRVVGFITYGKEMKGHLLAGLPVYYFEDASNVRYVAVKADIDGVLCPYDADAPRAGPPHQLLPRGRRPTSPRASAEMTEGKP